MYSCALLHFRAFSKFIESLSDIKQEKYDAEDKKRGVDHKVIGYVTMNQSLDKIEVFFYLISLVLVGFSLTGLFIYYSFKSKT